ncbi:Uncharacterized protein TCAP_04517 [Tolypocladium capitatum]|uniref:Uncharacterized protein n=1 Tax=Tolypocladium capitatum TaxID=45235 RepID=A0A2K3QDE8_9HYPO|nr:Uncharacterized protein TCAP_04517 [Tolypocladium capitatum]
MARLCLETRIYIMVHARNRSNREFGINLVAVLYLQHKTTSREVKGPDRSAAVAKRQLCYDIALGARGMNAL